MKLISSSNKCIVKKSAFFKSLENWNPYNPLVVLDDHSGKKISVLSINKFSDVVIKSLNKRFTIIFLLETLTVIFLFLAGICFNNKKAINVSIGLLMIDIFTFIEFKLNISNKDNLRERSNFIFILRKNYLSGFAPWLIFMIICGLAQFIFQEIYGSFYRIMILYGAVDNLILSGQWWRLLTGPTIHANITHWAANTSFLLVIGPIATFLSRRNAAVAFLLGVIIGAAGVVFLDKTHDSFVGISSGVYSLFSWCAVSGFVKPKVLPKNFSMTLIAFSLMSIGLAFLFFSNASSISHFIGLVVGGCYALFSARILQERSFGDDFLQQPD